MTQTANAQLTDEIIVTATKKSTNLQDTAVSITAYTGESIQKLGLENSVSLAAQTPGLNVGTPVGEGNNPSLHYAVSGSTTLMTTMKARSLFTLMRCIMQLFQA